MTAICLAHPAAAQTRAVAGQFGILGEWDLTATLTKQSSEQWVGPVRLNGEQLGPPQVAGQQ